MKSSMKVGDLVKEYFSGLHGVVLAIGYNCEYKDYLESPSLNPEIHVLTPNGHRVWSYKTVEILTGENL